MMKLLSLLQIVFLISLFAFQAQAFTLSSSDRKGFRVHEITVDAATSGQGTDCSNAGMDRSSLLGLIEESSDQFWNKVATSRLELEKGEGRNVDVDGLTELGDIAQEARANTILVTCSDDIPEFAGGGVGAVGGFGCQGDTCRGAVVINAHAQSPVPQMSRAELLALFAHEMGHALGLGHSSVEEALMYYSTGTKNQEFLHQDDIRGITYLYPQEKELGGLLGACGTIHLNDKNPPSSGNGVPFVLLGLLLFLPFLLGRYLPQKLHRWI